MATASPSPHTSDPLRFTIMGPVIAWEPPARHLQLGERHLCVAPQVSVAGLVQGVEVSASGVRKGPSAARWVVTKLSLVPIARETDPPRGNTW